MFPESVSPAGFIPRIRREKRDCLLFQHGLRAWHASCCYLE
jgi:hypothetical protein